MDIKQAFNTPVLITKIIGSSYISENTEGSILNQSITIDSDTSSYANEEPITIKNTKISYSDLGLLNPPKITTSTAANNLNLLENSYYSSVNTSAQSIIDTDSELRSLYNDIKSDILSSINSNDYVTKETYLLLSLQSLVDFITVACSNFIFNNDIKSFSNKLNYNYIINGLCNSLLYISKGIKLISGLIGQPEITSNYAYKINNEVSSALFCIESDITGLSKNKTVKINKYALNAINLSIKQCKELLVINKTSEVTPTNFVDSISKLINCINLTVDKLLDLESKSKHLSSKNITSLIQNLSRLTELSLSAIYLAYSDINNNYSYIINNLKTAISFIKSISFTSEPPKLFTNFNSNILLTKSYSKDLTNTDLLNPIINNSNPSNLVINSDKPVIIQNVTLSLSFYVYDLKINVDGTIGNDAFNGHIYYPELYNLDSLNINNLIINTEISIPTHIQTFNVNQYLTPKLEVINLVPVCPYTASTPSFFKANISFSLNLNGEIVATALLPLVISK